MSVTTMTTIFGEVVTARITNGNLVTKIAGQFDRIAFALSSEQGMRILECPDGRWSLVYGGASETPIERYSSDNGRTWTQL